MATHPSNTDLEARSGGSPVRPSPRKGVRDLRLATRLRGASSERTPARAKTAKRIGADKDGYAATARSTSAETTLNPNPSDTRADEIERSLRNAELNP
jgi:hypothetical protein